MIIERFIGGESQGRSLLGGRRNRPRTIGLVAVGVVGLFVVIMWKLPGLIAVAIAAAIVWALTTGTHFGSPLQRIQARRRWGWRRKTGRAAFVPVDRRPAELDERRARASKRGRKRIDIEWTKFRDWPDGVEGLNWLQAAPGVPGILWHTPTGQEPYCTVGFPVRGQIQGLEGDSAINGAAARFGRLLAGWGSPRALVSGVQMLTRVLPVDSARHEQWVRDNVDWDTPTPLLESYDDVVRQVGRGGMMQRHYVVVRWPISPQFLAAAARRAPGHEGWRQLLGREVDAAHRALTAARLEPGPALTAAQTAALFRHLQMPSWPSDQGADVAVMWPWLASEDAWSYTRQVDVGPSGEVEEWYHRTARLPIEGIGTGARTPLWLLPFLTQLPQDIVRSFSVEIELVPAGVARQQARADLSSDLADLYAQQRKGALTSEDLEVTKRAAEARRNDLAPGSGAQGAGYALHVSLSARSVEALADACAVVEECLGTDLDIEDVAWLDPDQSSAAATCWPVARGMRPVDSTRSAWIRTRLAGKGHKEALT